MLKKQGLLLNGFGGEFLEVWGYVNEFWEFFDIYEILRNLNNFISLGPLSGSQKILMILHPHNFLHQGCLERKPNKKKKKA